MTDNIPELPFVKDLELIGILKTIKQIQARMKQSDLVNAEFAIVYETLLDEFPEFTTKYNNIFLSLIRGDKTESLATILYYRSKVVNGEMTEEELSNKLAEKYMPRQ